MLKIKKIKIFFNIKKKQIVLKNNIDDVTNHTLNINPSCMLVLIIIINK